MSSCCHDNGYAAGPVLIKTKIPRFYLKQGSFTSKNVMGRVKTIREPCVPSKNLRPFSKGCKWAYFVFRRKRLQPKVLPWQQHGRCHSVSFVMYISGAKFEEHCSNFFLEIFLIQCFTVQLERFMTSSLCSFAQCKRKYL